MAGKIRFLLYRDGRYYARRVVPQELRPILGKNELRAPLGPDRRGAVERLPFELVKINAHIDHARDILKLRSNAMEDRERSSTAPMSPEELARNHYLSRLADDEQARNSGPAWASTSIDDTYVHDLRQILAGRLSDDAIQSVLGQVLERQRRRGTLEATPSSPQWRAAARAIADAELNVLEKVVARDEGNAPSSEVHPTHLAPVSIEIEEVAFQAPVSLRGLLEKHAVSAWTTVSDLDKAARLQVRSRSVGSSVE